MEWGKTKEGLSKLVSSFMVNDPYYPRPRTQDHNYQIFRDAYLAACPVDEDALDVARAFLVGIEKEQARRDSEHGDFRNWGC